MRKATVFVPPGGFAGFAQMTPAVQALVRPGARRATTTTRRRKATKKTTRRKATVRRKTTRRAAPKKKARLVKGSAAAKAHMAKLRRMRRG